jgi:hypothetical protein
LRNNLVVLIALLGLAMSEPRVEGQRPIDGRNRDNFRSGSELVTTAVTVRDGDGRLVTNLEQKDFTIEEDSVAQPITQFTKERVPVSLSLTLDISDSMRGQRIIDARARSTAFLDSLLAVEDEARSSASITPRACSGHGRPIARACARSWRRSSRRAAPRSTMPSTRRCRCSSRASIRGRRSCSSPTAPTPPAT